MTLSPDDVVTAAAFVIRALTPAVDADWSVAVPALGSTVAETVGHSAGAPMKYALMLASGSQRNVVVVPKAYPDATNAELLEMVRAAADALAFVAGAVPASRRAFHQAGIADAEGFVGMGCVELLVHGHDVAGVLGLVYEPPADLCQRVVARMFPDASDRGWTALVGITRHGPPDWMWRAEPLERR